MRLFVFITKGIVFAFNLQTTVKMRTATNQFIYPDQKGQIEYWSKKWNVTYKQLSDAILETGSLKKQDIAHYLIDKKANLYSFGLWVENVRTILSI